MKNKLKALFASLVILLGMHIQTKAQVSLSVRIGNPPAWAPRERAYQVRYYYLPELDAYYDAQRQGYYYANGGGWIFTPTLPQMYAGYDFYTGPKIEVNYFGDRPFEFFRAQREDYFRTYHPGGHLDFTGGYLYRRGSVSGWDRRMHREIRQDRREDRRERREWREGRGDNRRY